jgi:transposase
MRAIIVLTESEKIELRERKKTERNNKLYRRLIYVEMSSQKMTNLKISSILGVSNELLTTWGKLFRDGGFKKLCTLNYEGRRTSKLERCRKAIEELEENKGFSTLKELKDWLKKEQKVESCISNLFYFCKKNSIFLTKKLD